MRSQYISRSRRLRALCLLAISGALLGCADVVLPAWVPQKTIETSPEPKATAQSEGIPLSGTETAATLDQSSASERRAAARDVSASRSLGTTVASLGDATEQGFWLKTPLVTEVTQGVVRSRATGKSAAVTLIPISGPATAGSRVSLSTLRILELPLTDLAELDVARSS